MNGVFKIWLRLRIFWENKNEHTPNPSFWPWKYVHQVLDKYMSLGKQIKVNIYCGHEVHFLIALFDALLTCIHTVPHSPHAKLRLTILHFPIRRILTIKDKSPWCVYLDINNRKEQNTNSIHSYSPVVGAKPFETENLASEDHDGFLV